MIRLITAKHGFNRIVIHLHTTANKMTGEEVAEMLAIGAHELQAPLGETVECPHCGQLHRIEFGEEILSDGTCKPSKLLGAYKCGDNLYLAGINGLALQRRVRALVTAGKET